MSSSPGGGEGWGEAEDAANSPTLSLAATQAGVILGMAAYMAPEQAKGKSVDKRADIWAFGCVLYEMLTGRRAFEGDDVTDTLAAVVRGEPEWERLPADIRAGVRRLLRRCLAKKRRDRLPDVAVARMDIVEALAAPGTPVVAARDAPARPHHVEVKTALRDLYGCRLARLYLYDSYARGQQDSESAPRRSPLGLDRGAWGRRAAEKSLDADVLVDIRPMDPKPRTGNLPVRSLFWSRVQ